MILSVDTRHDSHDDIRKVIAMLQHLVGEKQLVSNVPLEQSSQAEMAPFANLFQDLPVSQGSQSQESSYVIIPELAPVQDAKKSDADLFSDLFTKEDVPGQKERGKEEDKEENSEVVGYSSSRKPEIEFY